MAADHRIPAADGRRLPFTCMNKRYMTDVTAGFPHAPRGEARGSVIEGPLFDYEDASIWLEHVVDRETGETCYWLMWYNTDGRPTIPLSGVFGRSEIERATEALRTLRL